MNLSPQAFPVLLFLFGIAGGCAPDGDGSHVVGQLESDRVEVAAEVAEPILERLVSEGQRVSAGTALMQQDTARIRASIAEATAALAQSRARQDELIRGPRREQIVSAQASVAGAERDLEFRRAQFERASELLDKKLASEEVRDEARAALDAATSNLGVQRARLAELLSGTTVEELRQAEQNVLQYESRMAALNIDLERHTIRAPVDGLVDSILFEPGERPVPMKAAVIMLAGAQPYARVYVSETVRARVRAGTSATVFVDGIETPFDARVRWIASDAAFTPYFALTEHDRGRLTYFATIDIQATGERLP
ncbi:MAG: HlyD family efflux transporter periplasmic adaptor subunit, partial [Woeseiaceae bacterium]